eukprot:8535021-Pyramimonas_sp.AAC.1
MMRRKEIGKVGTRARARWNLIERRRPRLLQQTQAAHAQREEITWISEIFLHEQRFGTQLCQGAVPRNIHAGPHYTQHLDKTGIGAHIMALLQNIAEPLGVEAVLEPSASRQG